VPDKQPVSGTVKGTITIARELCKECGLCIYFCPKKVIVQSDRLNAAGYQSAEFKDNGGCTGCAVCAIVCPEVAIEVYRD
jgi:2-oxoglutarate ferredoxin oxidoreductase subunit delta